MVVVLKKPKLVYIEEPRTASRSTHLWLTGTMGGVSPWLAKKKNGLPAHTQRHMGPVSFLKLFHKGELPPVSFMRGHADEYDFFAFTRNPFSTLVTYYLKAKHKLLAVDRKTEYRLAARTSSFKEYIMRLLAEHPGILSEESHLCRLDACQHILRFEDGYPNVLFDFLDSHGVPVSDAQKKAFPCEGKTQYKKKDWRIYYEDAEIIEVVANVYKNYLARYGYGFDCN